MNEFVRSPARMNNTPLGRKAAIVNTLCTGWRFSRLQPASRHALGIFTDIQLNKFALIEHALRPRPCASSRVSCANLQGACSKFCVFTSIYRIILWFYKLINEGLRVLFRVEYCTHI